MSHDAFESERVRVERVLDILEQVTNRLEGHADVPLAVLADAVAFIKASEDAAYEAAQVGAGEVVLSACLDQHLAAREPLRGMMHALAAIERGEAGASTRFVRHARDYGRLRRDHMRADDRLFATNERPPLERVHTGSDDSLETSGTRQIYDRLIEMSTRLGGEPCNR